MKSKTKAIVSESDILTLLNSLYPEKESPSSIIELTDGYFNTSFRVNYDSEKSLIIKTGPPKGIDLLSYEENMMSTEIFIHNKIQELDDVPVPRILHVDQSRTLLPYEFFIMEALEGKPLQKYPDLSKDERKRIYIPLARYMARIHSLKGSHFGYAIWKDEMAGKSYFEVFLAMVDKILDDGKRTGASIPLSEKLIHDFLNSFSDCFHSDRDPVLVHYDLWDGNLFVTEKGDGLELEAIIDFERGFYADPTADFSQIAPFVDLTQDSWFLEEYNKFSEIPFIPDKKSLIRTSLYRFYLYLIMVVESYYRDVEGSFEGQKKWSEEELVRLYNQLR